MRISLFTPTHDPRYLLETWHSLQFQDYHDYEWVIAPNSGATIPQPIRDDPHVVITEQCHSSNIGALKRFACDRASGDVFAELDHDDLLAPGILTQIAKAADRGAGFIFSDVGLFAIKDGEYFVTSYSARHNWEPYLCQVYERPVIASKAFPVNARTLCEVYYAPDHIRCWTREAYYKAGGHNPDLSVGDDHQLMIKTYLTGAEFHHIQQVGYLYRLHETNTVKTRNAKIQEIVAMNRLEYTEPLVREWSRREGLQVVDLAEHWKTGAWNLGDQLRYPANSVGLFIINEGLQFLLPEQQVPFFNQAYDALAPGGWLSGRVPSTNSAYAFQDPRHKTFFNHNSLKFYCDKAFAANNPDISCRFQLVQNLECHVTPWYKENDMKVIKFDMCALKGQRHPGTCKI